MVQSVRCMPFTLLAAPRTVMDIASESAICLHVNFELPPREAFSQVYNPHDLRSILIQKSEGSKNKYLMSLIILGTVCHHEGDSGFSCETGR